MLQCRKIKRKITKKVFRIVFTTLYMDITAAVMLQLFKANCDIIAVGNTVTVYISKFQPTALLFYEQKEELWGGISPPNSLQMGNSYKCQFL